MSKDEPQRAQSREEARATSHEGDETAEVVDDTAAAGEVATTEAKRKPRKPSKANKAQRDAERAKLTAELAKKRCRSCGTTGLWDVTSSPTPDEEETPRTRYVRCRGCQRRDKVVVEAAESGRGTR